MGSSIPARSGNRRRLPFKRPLMTRPASLIVSWSSGKDSAYMLGELLNEGNPGMLTLAGSLIEDLNGGVPFDEVGEFAVVAGSADNMIVDPMIIASPRFSH